MPDILYRPVIAEHIPALAEIRAAKFLRSALIQVMNIQKKIYTTNGAANLNEHCMYLNDISNVK
jgi:hypothetical protein